MARRKITTLLISIIVIAAMAGTVNGLLTPAMNKFNGGEFGPGMLTRWDFAKYDNACKQLQNMLVLSQGPVTRRPGTKFIATTKNNAVARLIPFEYSKTDTYMLEFTNLLMRAYRNGGLILDGANPFELVTTFTTAELDEIQFVQSADVMWLVHPDHKPQELSRTGHTSWTIADAGIKNGPFLTKNITATTITPSATTGTITLTASTAIFQAGHVGSLWQVTGIVDNSSVNGSHGGVANSSTVTVLKGQEYIFTTHGTWTGTVILQRSYDAGVTFQDVVTRHYEDDGNMDFTESEKVDDAIYRVRMDSHSSGTLDYNFEALTTSLDGVVEITVFTNTTLVTGTVESTLGNTTATLDWNEPYFSDVDGWPATVEFHEQRIVYGGNASYPQTLWMSKSFDFDDFKDGTLADNAIIYSLPGQNPIQWLRSQEFLFIGTLGGTGRLGGNRLDDPISAEAEPNYKTQSYAGSANLQAIVTGENILYLERGRRRIREFVFSIERDRYVSPDLTILADNITESGIDQAAFQSRPESVLWSVTGDGELLSMTYKRDEDVIAWARHVTDGTVESVGTIPGTEEDEVWIIVNRTIETNTKRYVEQMQPLDWGSDNADMWFVDSGLAFDGGDAVNITDITQALPAVVTMTTYPTDGDGDNLADGDQVQIRSVSGMTEVNDKIYTISNPNVGNKTFELRDSTDITDIDSTGFTAYTSGGTIQRVENTFAGLDHLEGETVVSLADAATVAEEVVSSGTITLDRWANKVVSGLEYTSILETMPIVLGGQDGTSMARIKRIISVKFDFLETLGTEFGPDADNLRPLNFQTTETGLSGAVDLFTGKKKQTFQHGYERQSTVYLQQTLPLPFTLRAIVPDIEIFN